MISTNPNLLAFKGNVIVREQLSEKTRAFFNSASPSTKGPFSLEGGKDKFIFFKCPDTEDDPNHTMLNERRIPNVILNDEELKEMQDGIKDGKHPTIYYFYKKLFWYVKLKK